MKNFRTKVQKISDPSKQITPFAGIYFVNRMFQESGLSQLIDKELGRRQSTKGYRYSDIIKNYINIFFCGGNCAEDIRIHFRKTLEQIPENRVPSADTVLRGIRELSVDNIAVVSDAQKSYNFNINSSLNNLMIKALKLTGQLRKNESYDLDFDHQILENDKYDAKRTCKKNTGYFPGIASIGDRIVYIENRDGNTNVKLSQSETLTRMFAALEANGIKISRARMDAGSYSKEIIDTVSKNCDRFYIRANRCAKMTEEIRNIKEWRKIEINYKVYETASIEFGQFFEDRNYRLVITREESEDKQLDLFTGDRKIYRGILTNDREGTEKEIVEYYNQRGASEKLFDIQNNDFGWNHLPCSDMEYNTVYLTIMAMAKNFYTYVLSKVSAVFSDISPVARMKQFIYRFITVAGYRVFRNRQRILRLYTDRPYELLTG